MNPSNLLPDSIKPEDDARLPVLEARIEREWRQFRPKYVRDLEKRGKLQWEVHQTAIWCIETLNQFEEKGLNPDQGREAIRGLIHPQFDRS